MDMQPGNARTSQLHGLIEIPDVLKLISLLAEAIAPEHAPEDHHMFVADPERPAFCEECLKRGHWWIKPDVLDWGACRHTVLYHATYKLERTISAVISPLPMSALELSVFLEVMNLMSDPRFLVITMTDFDPRNPFFG